jgi:hypothetical protein
MYARARTFEEVCDMGAKYVIDEIREHPFWRENDRALYELDDDNTDHQFIKHVIHECNLHGLFTTISQPEISYETRIYKSHWHRMMDSERKMLD